MADVKFTMTKEKYDEFVAQKIYLETTVLEEIVKRIQEARGHGDLSENAEYSAAKEEQRTTYGKIADLENMIKNAEIIEISNDTKNVHIGSIVNVYDIDMDEEIEYTIGTVTDFDVMNNKISNESPLGKALLNKEVGECVKVPCPDGSTYELKILRIRKGNL